MTKEPLRVLMMENDADLAYVCKERLVKVGYVVNHLF